MQISPNFLSELCCLRSILILSLATIYSKSCSEAQDHVDVFHFPSTSPLSLSCHPSLNMYAGIATAISYIKGQVTKPDPGNATVVLLNFG